MKYRYLGLATCVLLLGLAGCGGGTDDTSSDDATSNVDALAYSKTNYSFTCPSGSTYSVPVSNGPCIESQKAFSKATVCNQPGSGTIPYAYAGKPFYQCLVSNSTGDYKTYYQKYLTFYGG